MFNTLNYEWKNQEFSVKIFLMKIKEFFLNLFFPVYCVNCQREANYLCQDCFALIDFSTWQYCPFCRKPKIVLDGKTCYSCRKTRNLTGLFAAAPYKNFIIKKLISQFKYKPYIKNLSKILASLIIHHFQLIEKQDSFPQPPISINKRGDNPLLIINRFRKKAILIPVPLTKKKQKERGFNQSEEIAKELSQFFYPVRSFTNIDITKYLGTKISNRVKIPLLDNVLIKIKETRHQVELSRKEREENIKGAFWCKEPDKVKGKTIFLIDDVFTTGSTMEECARVLKQAGAKRIWGIVVARE